MSGRSTAKSSAGPAPEAAQVTSTWWFLLKTTIGLSLRYRVTALAAEVGFFALLALPPLVLALAAAAAWLGSRLGVSLELEAAVREYLTPFLTADVVDTVIVPTLTDALHTPRYDVISIGFILSLWSGSRAMHVYLDTISIMYGLARVRSLLVSRMMAFGLYLAALVLGSVSLPLMLLGPELISHLLPTHLADLSLLYWPIVGVAVLVLLALLFHVSVPIRTRWWRNLPGAMLAVGIWLAASAVMQLALAVSLSPTESTTRSLSIYGPLTTPIVVLMWFYLLAIAVLVGAALNVAVDHRWPDGERSAKRAEAAEQLAQESGFGRTLTPVRDADIERKASRYGAGAAAAFHASKADTGRQAQVRRKPPLATPGGAAPSPPATPGGAAPSPSATPRRRTRSPSVLPGGPQTGPITLVHPKRPTSSGPGSRPDDGRPAEPTDPGGPAAPGAPTDSGSPTAPGAPSENGTSAEGPAGSARP